MDCKDVLAMIKKPKVWPNFSTELKEIEDLQQILHNFRIFYIPRGQNDIADSLSRTIRAFHIKLYFVDCSIPI